MMFPNPNNFRKCAFLFTLSLGLLPIATVGQSIEVDPADEIEAIFGEQETVVKITEVLKFRFRPFMDGLLKEEVKQLMFGVPYVIEATFDVDPGEDRIGIALNWPAEKTAMDELEMVRVSEGDKTFYRAVKMIILVQRELDILEIIEAGD